MRDDALGEFREHGDEYLQNLFWRALFIDCLVGNGAVTEPEEWVTECRERQQQATSRMRDIAATLPGEVLTDYREFMAHNLLGRAFAALVQLEQDSDDSHWTALAAVAETLCLYDLLGDDEPAADADDFVLAAHVVRLRVTAAPGH